MTKKLMILTFVFAIAAVAGIVATPVTVEAGRGDGPIVYVTSQGLFYDSIITADPLPPEGDFQLLEMGGPSGTLMTEFGPGDPEYLGGRWKEDFDGDGTFHFFSCPLLGPGRASP